MKFMKSDEESGMYEDPIGYTVEVNPETGERKIHYPAGPVIEGQEKLWNDVFQNYMQWQDQEPKLSDLLRDFKIEKR